MTFNLLRERWLSGRARSGEIRLFAPAELAATEPDPIAMLAWPRPDLGLACYEFLIGLLTTALATPELETWDELLQKPPDRQALERAFLPFEDAFNLDGDGPRFMQDLERFQGEINPISSLLIEQPGANTSKRNADLMVRRGRVRAMSRGAAAMSLYTLQTYAPSGGAGNRTGLRGGGPLTTLVLPGGEPLLWRTLWANVPLREPIDAAARKHVFPWLVATRQSPSDAHITTPADVHAGQEYWGMPRRIVLEFDDARDGESCDITGHGDAVMARGWRQRPRGTNYVGWRHSLSPYYVIKPGQAALPVHPQADGIGYRHWVGLLSRNPAEARIAAANVHQYRALRLGTGERWRLLAGGYDMDNMKARGFVESEIPVIEADSEADAGAQERFTERLVDAAGRVASLLVRSIRSATFSDGAKVDTDRSSFSAAKTAFWSQTEDRFHELLERSARSGSDRIALAEEWRLHLLEVATAVFDRAAPLGDRADGHPARVVAASIRMRHVLSGFRTEGAELYTVLGLANPETATKKKGRRA